MTNNIAFFVPGTNVLTFTSTTTQMRPDSTSKPRFVTRSSGVNDGCSLASVRLLVTERQH